MLFQGLGIAAEEQSVQMEVADADLATREACFYLFVKFAKEVWTLAIHISCCIFVDNFPL